MGVFDDEIELDAALAEAGLRLDRWLDEEGGRWFVAVPAWERRCTGDKL
jgi:hypothetical protein